MHKISNFLGFVVFSGVFWYVAAQRFEPMGILPIPGVIILTAIAAICLVREYREAAMDFCAGIYRWFCFPDEEFRRALREGRDIRPFVDFED